MLDAAIPRGAGSVLFRDCRLPAGPGGGARLSWPREVANELSGLVAGSAVQAGRVPGGVHVHATMPSGLVAPVPRQLPPRPAHFIDRSGPLAVIADAAATAGSSGPLVIVVVTGLAEQARPLSPCTACTRRLNCFPAGIFMPRSAVSHPAAGSPRNRSGPVAARSRRAPGGGARWPGRGRCHVPLGDGRQPGRRAG